MKEKIVKVNPSHLVSIVNIVSQYQIDKLTDKEKNLHGFLVSNYDLEAYNTFIKKAKYFYVLIVDGIVKGFIMAFKSSSMDPNDYIKEEILKRLPEPFVVIKQICIDKAESRKGYAQKLYNHLFEKTKNLPVLAGIVSDPINPRSEAFHKKMGFQKFFDYTPTDGFLRSMWILKKRNNPDNLYLNARSPNHDFSHHNNGAEVLVNQLFVASELYRHEDTLNWSKVNHLLYVNVGLGALFGFFWKNKDLWRDLDLYQYTPLFFVAIVGIIVSIIFSIAIIFGVVYLLDRKSGIDKIDQELGRISNCVVLSKKIRRVGDKQFSYRKYSPTSIVICMIPIATTLVWLFVLVLLNVT